MRGLNRLRSQKMIVGVSLQEPKTFRFPNHVQSKKKGDNFAAPLMLERPSVIACF